MSHLLGIVWYLRNESLTHLTAKRLPYCDHVIALNSEGEIVEQGTYDKLNQSGGYVSSFDLPPPDWDFTPEKHVYEAPPRYTERTTSDKVTEDDIQAEANRRTGDTAIYLYYIRSVGWVPTMIFVVSITIFIFGQLFPSKLLLCQIFCEAILRVSSLVGERMGFVQRRSP